MLTAMKQTAHKLHRKVTRTISTRYWLTLPADYAKQPKKKWPLLLFLHGAGERGDNLELVKVHGPTKLIKQGQQFPFIVVAPQCPANDWWRPDVLAALLDDIERQYRVDKRRVYVTGISMGGFGTWNLALSHPERFAAIAPICGGGETILITLAQLYDPAKLAQMKTLGVWAFHGGKDTTVTPDESEHMVNALKKVGCTDVKLTIYPEAQHDSWTQTYANPELFTWFLQHSR